MVQTLPYRSPLVLVRDAPDGTPAIVTVLLGVASASASKLGVRAEERRAGTDTLEPAAPAATVGVYATGLTVRLIRAAVESAWLAPSAVWDCTDSAMLAVSSSAACNVRLLSTPAAR